jgi:hypothetical protein
VSHHTNLRGVDELVDEAKDEIRSLMAMRLGSGGAERADREVTRNVLVQLIADWRANFPLQRALKHLAGIFGDLEGGFVHGRGGEMTEILLRLEARACEEKPSEPVVIEPPPRPATPLPLGIATPVPGDDDGRDTPLRPEIGAAQNPPNPIEVNVDRHHAPTRKVTGQRDVEGPWKPRDPSRRR